MAAYISSVLVDVCMSHCNEPSADTKCGEFCDYLRTSQVSKKDCFMDSLFIYEGWNFSSGNYLFTTDTK